MGDTFPASSNVPPLPPPSAPGSSSLRGDEAAEQLRTALARWWAVLRGMGSPAPDNARPGLPEDEVRRRLGEVGLIAPVEVLTWFAWHDGIEVRQRRDGQRPPPWPFTDWDVGPNRRPFSLREALSLYTDFVAPGVEVYNDHPGWLPLVERVNGVAVVARCGLTGESAPAQRVDEPSAVTLWYVDDGLRQPAGSLAQVVRAWTVLLDGGPWVPDPHEPGWVGPPLNKVYPDWYPTHLL
ncbi:hypothetical protein [Kineococcus indalonis]|uniref:hypothetical protein n=1 Tax=Kineococcus indalonis TaxID=2696566 RepID=UPI00141224CE|nr:hypothetical protein [Kineococcus indalonis]NAZ85200.1 hypothetical protein [Kineococcus indalonis]